VQDDTTPPISTMSINAAAVITNTTAVTINSAVTGATQMRFMNAGGTWSAWLPYASTKAWTLATGNGIKTVNALYRYAAGNILSKSDTIVLYSLAPLGGMFINAGFIQSF